MEADLLSQFQRWCAGRAEIVAVVLFGSQVPSSDGSRSADCFSDIDLQVVTWIPGVFESNQWHACFGEKPVLCVCGEASSGSLKVKALWCGERCMDIVVIDAFRMWIAWVLVGVSFHSVSDYFQSVLSELATVMRGGFRVLKGERVWSSFYSRVVREIRGDRLDDSAVFVLAERFVCDYVWVKKKAQRGELMAARRCMVRSLWESNIRLLYELRLREGQAAWRDARRLEMILKPNELRLVIPGLSAKPGELFCELEETRTCFLFLVARLVSNRWRWPDKL